MKAYLTITTVLLLLVLFLVTVVRAQQPELVVQAGHSREVYSVAFSPDGKTLASGSYDETIKLWEVATGREFRTLSGHGSVVASIAFSADGKTIASGSSDAKIKLWDVAAGRELRTLSGHSDAVPSLAFSADGKTLASGSYDKTIKLWEVATGRELRMLTGHSREVYSVAFSPDRKTLASGSLDNTIRFWEVATGRELRTLTGHSSWIMSVAFSGDGKMLASGSVDKTIKLWEVTTGRELRTLSGHLSFVSSVAFSTDGKTLASSGGEVLVPDNSIKLWEVSSGRELYSLHGHSRGVTSISFSADGKTLASGSGDQTIKLWEIATGRELRTLADHSSLVLSVALSADDKMLATAGRDKTINLWNLTGRELRVLAGHSDSVTSVAFSRDGKTLASGCYDGKIKLWDVITGSESRTLTAHPDVISAIVFSADAKTVASGSYDKTIKLWDVATGRELRTLTGHTGNINSITFSPDGKILASGSWDKTIKFWDVESGRELRTLTGHSNWVMSVEFSLDGKTLASGSADTTIKFWDVATGREMRSLPGGPGAIMALALSGDGKTIAGGSTDKRIRLWDMVSGRELRALAGHSSEVLSVRLSANGKFVVSGSIDATTNLWRADSGELLASLRSFENGGWAVITPDGRFDTNSLEEIPNLNWMFPDDPFKPLPPEIFMRQYYEPRLLPRLLQGKSFNPVPPLASLNRVQPEVRISSVSAPDSAGYLNVTVEVASASGEQMRDRKRVTLKSEVHDLRLFRDGQLVGYIAGKIPLDNAGKATLVRAVKLPRRGERNDVEFTAYAFNSDQVKSATSNYTYKPAQAVPTVRGRAYIISVGVNAYEDPSWRLSFAARDARVSEEILTRKLTAAGEYEVVALTLTSDYPSGQTLTATEKLATKQNFHTVLKVLAGALDKIDPDILKAIPSVEKLRKVEPEDLVLISFSSHGYTDKQGKFYLVPYDTGTDIKSSADGQEIAPESLARFISSDELSEWVRDIDAGELVMIVDTCHSASAVDEPGFKPGPMGSRGMGQLAYDKGMRILAASQADDVALELDRLKHGLLTYALIEEGLNQQRADKNSDGRIMLDEWLSYGAERVPLLYEDVKAGKLELKTRDARITSLLAGASVRKNAFQQPQLFDFKRKRREIRLQ